jgi:leucyl/phenylalanyl-tRNA---protein transferase
LTKIDALNLPAQLGVSDPFPPLSAAWPEGTPAPGLLALGGDLSVGRLRSAYAQTIFPWFTQGDPILWWSPDPRMVLAPASFSPSLSLLKKMRSLWRTGRLDVRINQNFEQVMRACASAPRLGQNGTWIQPAMIDAYTAAHHAGMAHSIETWIDGELAGGLYAVAIGRAVFGESMFHRVNDASKIALAALVGFCAAHGVVWIDCQMKTNHLASLGAVEVPREVFAASVAAQSKEADLPWPQAHSLAPVYWIDALRPT